MKNKYYLMKTFIFTVFMIIVLTPLAGFCQLEKVIVEKYYISDSNDATDTIGGLLESRSITYRIFVDLMPGSKLTKIYGDAGHALKFSSTTSFFNNKSDGQTFAKEFSKSRYSENTVALDTWLTLGQTTRLSSKTYFGTLKSMDRDGSFIGGMNNDGGSAAIPSGLLSNEDAEAGIPLTVSDGMDTMTTLPGSWADYGFADLVTGDDSTIFGSLKQGNEFVSNDAGLQNSGVEGVHPDSNIILIGQLTTTGDFSFELNIEVLEPAVPNPVLVKYVSALAPGEVNSSILKVNPFLKYPASCGCTDPNFLEFNQSYSCLNSDSCRTRIVFGCMDVNACNFDPAANFNVQQLCCYPGYCNDRDIAVVCPQLNVERADQINLSILPNPVTENSKLNFTLSEQQNVSFALYNSIGKAITIKDLGVVSGIIEVPIGSLLSSSGVYVLKLFTKEKIYSIKLIK